MRPLGLYLGHQCESSLNRGRHHCCNRHVLSSTFPLLKPSKYCRTVGVPFVAIHYTYLKYILARKNGVSKQQGVSSAETNCAIQSGVTTGRRCSPLRKRLHFGKERQARLCAFAKHESAPAESAIYFIWCRHVVRPKPKKKKVFVSPRYYTAIITRYPTPAYMY